MNNVNRLTLAASAISLLLTLFISCGGGSSTMAVTTNDAGFRQVEAIDMVLQWKIEGSTIEIIVESPETGWVGVGFDPEEFMKGADFIIGYVEDGITIIEDHYGDKLIDHSKDTDLGGSDNVTLIGGSQDSNGTMLHFSIPLNSGDQYDKQLSAGSIHTVLLAFGAVDDFTTTHGEDSRTSFEVEL